MRSAILLLAAAMPFASCTQPASQTVATPPVASSTSGGLEEISPAHQDQAEKVGNDLARKLAKICATSGSKTEIENCFKEHLVVAFDTEAVVKEHCSMGMGLEEHYKCVVFTSMAYDFWHLNGTSDAGFDWSDPNGSMAVAAVDLAIRAKHECDSSAFSSTSCQYDRYAALLGLDKAETAQCLLGADDYDRFQCMGELFGIHRMQAAVDRL